MWGWHEASSQTYSTQVCIFFPGAVKEIVFWVSTQYCLPLFVSLQVSITGEWIPWASKVPQIEVETHKVASPDVVVPTLDTVRHEALLYTWLAEHKPMVLCGPPGSGKTMTLFSALRALPDMEVGIIIMHSGPFWESYWATRSICHSHFLLSWIACR